MNSFALGLPQAVRSGQVRGPAQSTPERSPLAPELPTFAEAGVPEFNLSSTYGLFVPVKTPPDIVKRCLTIIKAANIKGE